MFICSHDAIGGYQSDVEEYPSTLARKRNPDRSWSPGKRIISYLRRIDLYFGQRTDYQLVLQTVAPIARRIARLRRKSPTADVLIAKLDCESAFRLIRMGPQMSKVMAMEIRGRHSGLCGGFLIFYGLLPFGWAAPPPPPPHPVEFRPVYRSNNHSAPNSGDNSHLVEFASRIPPQYVHRWMPIRRVEDRR